MYLNVLGSEFYRTMCMLSSINSAITYGQAGLCFRKGKVEANKSSDYALRLLESGVWDEILFHQNYVTSKD